MHTFDQKLLENHKNVMKELINRDKNRPSVIAWSVANEPRSNEQSAENYFHEIATFSRNFDPDHRLESLSSDKLLLENIDSIKCYLKFDQPRNCLSAHLTNKVCDIHVTTKVHFILL